MTAAPAGARPRLLDSQHRSLTIGIIASITLVAFEGTAVITAMPAMARELDALPLLAWIVNAFVAASLLGQVLAGGWADRLGPRLPLMTGIIAFAGGGMVAGFAVTFPMLLVGRGLQGFGAGVMIVVAYVIIGRAYDPRLRPKSFALLSTAWLVPAIVGPVIAGWLADYHSWRWVFLAVAPVAWIPVVIVMGRLRPYDGSVSDAQPRPGRARRGVLAAMGLVAVQDGAQRVGWLGLAEALVGLLLLIPALRQLLPPGTFRLRRGLPSVVVMRGLLAGAFFSAEAWVPLALQEERGVSTTWAGMFLACGAVGWAAGAWLQGRSPRSLTPPRLVALGATLVTVSLAILPVVLLPYVTPWVLGVSWVIGAFGMGMSVSSLSTLLLAYSDPGAQGVNSAAIQISDSSGVVLITGLTGAIFVVGGASAGVFSIMWLLAAAVAAVGIGVAPRARRPG